MLSRLTSLLPLRTQKIILFLGALGTCLPICLSAQAKPLRWTLEDQKQSVDLAIATAEAGGAAEAAAEAKGAILAPVLMDERLTEASLLLELALALRKTKSDNWGPLVISKMHLALARTPPHLLLLDSTLLLAGLAELHEKETAVTLIESQPNAIQPELWTDLGLALAKNHDVKSAEQAASHLDDGIDKVRLLDEVAKGYCADGHVQTDALERGQLVTKNIEDITKASLNDPGKRDSGDFAYFASEAIAQCGGPDAAIAFLKAFVPEQQVRNRLDGLAHTFARSGNMDIARALDPPLLQDSPEDLLREMTRSRERGELDAARALALRAWHMVDGGSSVKLATTPGYVRDKAFSALASLHAYDDALALLTSYQCPDRSDYNSELIKAAAAEKDRATIAKVLPDAMACDESAFKNGTGYADHLAELATTLADAGLIDLAQIPYSALLAIKPRPYLTRGTVAGVMSAMGDGAATCEKSDETAPLTTGVDPMAALVAAIMMGDGDKTASAMDKFASRMKEAKDHLPALVAGPRAKFLECSSVALAEAGEPEAALKLVDQLEEPKDVLEDVRNESLNAIAKAFGKMGDMKAELAIAKRMDNPLQRWKIVLGLATLPITP